MNFFELAIVGGPSLGRGGAGPIGRWSAGFGADADLVRAWGGWRIILVQGLNFLAFCTMTSVMSSEAETRTLRQKRDKYVSCAW